MINLKSIFISNDVCQYTHRFPDHSKDIKLHLKDELEMSPLMQFFHYWWKITFYKLYPHIWKSCLLLPVHRELKEFRLAPRYLGNNNKVSGELVQRKNMSSQLASNFKTPSPGPLFPVYSVRNLRICWHAFETWICAWLGIDNTVLHILSVSEKGGRPNSPFFTSVFFQWNMTSP